MENKDDILVEKQRGDNKENRAYYYNRKSNGSNEKAFEQKTANETVIADWNCTDQTSIPHVTGGVAMQMWLMNH